MIVRRKKSQSITGVILTLALILASGCSNSTPKISLEEQFTNPASGEAAPWTFWYWMYGAVSKEGITADLEAMNEIGLGGAYLMPIRSADDNKTFEYSPAYDQLTPEWWELIRFSMEEADRLGLKLGMHICDGFALAGGPWITPENSMQKMVWSEVVIDGGIVNNVPIPRPESYEGFYRDIALYAVPVKWDLSRDNVKPVVTSNGEDKNPAYLADMGDAGTFRSSEPCWIQYSFDEPFLCRSLRIVPGGNNFQAQRLAVYASDDGTHFNEIKQLTPPRQGWQNGDEAFTYSIPATEARYFRFYWDPAGTEPGSEDLDAAKWRPNLRVNRILLSGKAVIEQYEGKNGSVWRVSKRTGAEEIPDEVAVALDEIITLPVSTMKNDRLTAELPAGTWRIIRMGHTATGHTNATGGAGKGLECDKFSTEAVRIQLENWFGAAFRETDPVLARKVLKYMHVDSWECGSQNWSESFLDEFKQRRGYDLSPYLLVYTGTPIGSAEETESILHDIRHTIAELVVDVFYDALAEFSREYDCELSAECVSPTMVSDGMMHYRKVDRPMGEFWLNSPTHDKFNDMLDAISGARVYGKNIIQGEGFTQLRTLWNETPRMVKPLLDRNYALGLNKLFHHVYVHNPFMDQAPGVTLDGIGFYFQRDQTWWEQGKAWSDYINRCQTLLQFGHPVVDIAVFTGEEVPRRALLPERLVGSLPGLFGEEKVRWEQERLANEGQPLNVMPVGVTHSAGVTGAGEWIDALRGYAYDSFNRDVLLNYTEVKDGKILLPGGMEYRVLVIPNPYALSPHGEYMSEEVALKIKEIQEKGVVVLLGEKPTRIPSFYDKERATERLNELTSTIWSVSDEYLLPYNEPDFGRFGLTRDVELYGAKEVAWTHRAGEGTDIYFISNQKEERRTLDISLRCSGKQPQLWNPETGEIKDAERWSIENGRTRLSLELFPYQSLFIVLKHPTSATGSDKIPEVQEIALETGSWDILFERDSTLHYSETGLFDWSKEEDERVKYYAGAAVYKTTFQMDASLIDKEVQLDLGRVHDMAEVYLNGIYRGTAWTYPDRVNVTGALQVGENRLEIRVVNGWANRVKAVHEKWIDDPRVWTNATYWIGNQPLQPSGLLGPLTFVITD